MMRTYINSLAVAGALVLGPSAEAASTVLLDFEGLEEFETVGSFYDGGFGSFGSGPGPDYGVTFNNRATALIDRDAGGGGGFGGEPSPDTVIYISGAPFSDDAVVMDVAGGFEGGISFFYAMPNPNAAGVVSIYDLPGGSVGGGNLLGFVFLAPTPFNGAPDPTGEASPLLPLGASFNGIGRSVEFFGPAGNVVFDDISFSPRAAVPGVPEVADVISTILAGLLLISASLVAAQGQKQRRPVVCGAS